MGLNLCLSWKRVQPRKPSGLARIWAGVRPRNSMAVRLNDMGVQPRKILAVKGAWLESERGGGGVGKDEASAETERGAGGFPSTRARQ